MRYNIVQLATLLAAPHASPQFKLKPHALHTYRLNRIAGMQSAEARIGIEILSSFTSTYLRHVRRWNLYKAS